MHSTWLIVILIISSSKIAASKNSTTDLLDCAIEVANKHFNLRKYTVVLSHDVESFYINIFLKFYKGTVVVETKKDSILPKQVVVIVQSFYSFMKVLSKLKPDLNGKSLLDSGAKFMIVIFSQPHKLQRINNILWSYHAINSLIITSTNKNKIALYTYFPYKDYLNCQNTAPTLIGYWEKDQQFNKSIYPEKMMNMQGCPLYIATNKLYYPKTDEKLPLEIIKKTIIRLLRDIMNFTPIVSTRDYISIDSDQAKNWSDSLNDVVAGLANISTCTIPLGVDRLGLLDYSIPYFRIRLAWVSPPVGPGPVWWRLLSPLNGYLWVILFIVIFFVKSLPFSMRIGFVRRFCHKNFKNSDKLQAVAIRIWGVLLGQPVHVAPRRFRDFYIVGLWMWFTFVVRSAYQSVLIGALKTDTIVGAFADLKETVDHGYRFGGRGGILTHFEHDPLIREWYEVIPEREFEHIFCEVLNGKRRFVMATSLEYAWAFCSKIGKTENECGHVLPDSIMTLPLVVWMKMHSPFVRPLSVWLQRFMESGLLERDSKIKQVVAVKSSEASPLTGKQFASCLLCLFIGYMISFFVFILELVLHRTRK